MTTSVCSIHLKSVAAATYSLQVALGTLFAATLAPLLDERAGKLASFPLPTFPAVLLVLVASNAWPWVATRFIR